MDNKNWLWGLAAYLFAIQGSAQITSLVEDFNDNVLTGWEATSEYQRTFQLAEVAQTFERDLPPIVTVKSTNATQVGLYEKLEIIVQMEHASYYNPYDYEELDLRAIFTSPSCKTWEIYGFYDNYQNRNQWKIRFSPNELGEWHYVLRATDRDGTGESPSYSFTAVPSAHHGWLHVSSENPHYLIHDDGTSFYGVAAYYPWDVNNSDQGLGLLQASGCNMFGYWNVTYDDGTLIESLASGLGRYDQNKCGRIDAVLQWAEQRNMVVMFAIWPHDLFTENLAGWAALWDKNPYKTICSVLDIYENETAWKYQEKQYRYIIARWGYSRGLGIWEIINEINGTDAWERGGKIAQAEEWNRKVHRFLTTHDPFDRPTTSSQSGGRYWYNGYAAVDIPNVHLYETGWPGKFNGNPMRSSLWTYHTVTQQMWNDFAKPAILGEAGWLDNYGKYPGGSDEYAMMYHNALWSSWASGLSCTPVWWGFDPRVMDAKVLQRMKMFAKFVLQIDYAHRPFHPANVTMTNADGFAMTDDTTAFGWVRDAFGYDISDRAMQISGFVDTVYTIQWYDAWEGEVVATHFRPAIQGALTDHLPTSKGKRADMAFTIKRTEIGLQPYRLELFAEPRLLFTDGQSESLIQGYVLDAQDRLCLDAQTPLQFTLQGPGRLVGINPVPAQRGMASIVLRSDSVGVGTAWVIVSAPGLVGDTVTVEMTDVQKLDDFEAYGSLSSLQAIWKVRSGTTATVFLETDSVAAGLQGMRVQYSIGNGSPPYAGFFRDFPQCYRQSKYLRFWFKPDGSKRDLLILFHEAGNRYWQYAIPLNEQTARWVEIPLAELKSNDGTLGFDLSHVRSISFNVTKGGGDFGSGTLYFDELVFSNTILTSVTSPAPRSLPQAFSLAPNYPNPFNATTKIGYALPERTRVRLSIHNLLGQQVEVLVESVQDAGNHQIYWHAQNQPSGIYFYVLQTRDRVLKAKCVLIK